MELNSSKIKELMKENNLSQNKLAAKVNVSKGTISRVLNGKRRAGRKVIAGLLKTFPEETVKSMFKEKRSKPI
ncbi:helix-turn-helix domain-containing protein [Clostridium sporogenes]|uniref:helix-turn-helix domain-containing protein n=1 Tax=Clostridium sporogenes TaxID=1509 RepID=UPI00024BA028|nr:helix-turn-helix transcriptional regulator [Clostridium sporogenes]EHN13412.1 helix-turn-helix domain-containing protein [Clostridium sporogenes PA 3679]MDU4598315.1 helix-turn-helix transcriptional regulator [Clostridium sporogenes]NFQ33539.1 helix-turn-helix transcriptional regulator [Clostridium sporogenes]NFQ61183.1 helix-turn-helix transcriptional regulator [Clostridium sporogenes]NFU09094.1 helix-turn-helix transcriptional regulator [Clostridium sporogenes]